MKDKKQKPKREKIRIWQRIKNVSSRLGALELESLDIIKKVLFGVIVADIFGIYWYFELQTLGTGILILTMFMLGLVLFLENQKSGLDFNTVRGAAQTYLEDKFHNNKVEGGNNKMEQSEPVEKAPVETPKEEVKEEPKVEAKKEEPKPEEPKQQEGQEFGFPDAAEYEKNMEKAFGGPLV